MRETPGDDLGYVIGIIFTDGSVYRTSFKRRLTLPSGTHYVDTMTQVRVALQCKDRAFADRFAAALGRLTGRVPRVRPFERTMPKSTLKGRKEGYVFRGFEVKMATKELGLMLMEAKAGGAAFIATCDEALLRPMLIGVIDGDGHYSGPPSHQINITQKDPQWIIVLLRRLGVEHHLCDEPERPVKHIILPRREAEKIDTYKRHKR